MSRRSLSLVWPGQRGGRRLATLAKTALGDHAWRIVLQFAAVVIAPGLLDAQAVPFDQHPKLARHEVGQVKRDGVVMLAAVVVEPAIVVGYVLELTGLVPADFGFARDAAVQ